LARQYLQIASRHIKTYEVMENPNAQKNKKYHTVNKFNPREDSRQHENKTVNEKVLKAILYPRSTPKTMSTSCYGLQVTRPANIILVNMLFI
jgi:hypothetical protein